MKHKQPLTNEKVKVDLSKYLTKLPVNKKPASETASRLFQQRLYLAWSLYAEDKEIEPAAQRKIALIDSLESEDQTKLANVFTKFTFNESYPLLLEELSNLATSENSSPHLHVIALDLLDMIETHIEAANPESFVFRIGVHYRADSKIITQLYDKYFKNSKNHGHNIFVASNLEVSQATIVEGLQLSNPHDDSGIIRVSRQLYKNVEVDKDATDEVRTLHEALQERSELFPFKAIRVKMQNLIETTVHHHNPIIRSELPTSLVANQQPIKIKFSRE